MLCLVVELGVLIDAGPFDPTGAFILVAVSVSVKGLSTTTCLPASSARRARSTWVSLGVAITTTSTSGLASTSSTVPTSASGRSTCTFAGLPDPTTVSRTPVHSRSAARGRFCRHTHSLGAPHSTSAWRAVSSSLCDGPRQHTKGIDEAEASLPARSGPSCTEVNRVRGGGGTECPPSPGRAGDRCGRIPR